MSVRFSRFQPCLWFEHQAEEAARFYTSVFDDSRIVQTTHYDELSARTAGRPAGSVLTVTFELEGQPFIALNGGPAFKFNEAVSLVVNCHDQAEIDHYWERLSEGGPVEAQQCGWLKDRYGLSWQVVPASLDEMMRDAETAVRVMAAVLPMKKLDLATLEAAAAG